MKNIYLSLLALSSIVLANAQFTNSTEASIGDTKAMYVSDTSISDYSNIKGNGVIWDYSKLPITSTTPRNIAVKTPSSVSDKFPNSTKAIEIEGFATNFVSSSSSTYNSKGLLFNQPAPIGQVTVVMDANDEILMNYPYDFGSKHTDTYTATTTAAGSTFPCTGVGYFEVDGKGTLKLNGTTSITDVLRYKLIDTVKGSATTIFGKIDLEIVRIQYEYYKLSDSKLPLFVYSTLKMKAAPILNNPITTKLILNSVKNENVVSIATTSTNPFSIYPNPTKDNVTLGSVPEGTTYEFISLDGKIVLAGTTIIENETISLDKLTAGIYSLHVNGTTQLIVKN